MSPERLGTKTIESASSTRSAFDQDFDRIIFSQPFRNLQNKTQVHPLPEEEFVHTRLTHSLEVSSVGRSLGRIAGETIIQRYSELANRYSASDIGSIVAAASLTHDIGNPPFGHAGETAISDFFIHHPKGQSFKHHVTNEQWEDLCRFEGNAQGFRILTKRDSGVKLTKATLGAFTKYPCPALFTERNKKKRSQKKFGYFQSEKGIFEEVASSLRLTKTSDLSWNRHPLAFLVEAADDICYSIIDLEDGCNLGLIPYQEVEDLMTSVISSSKTKLGKLSQLVTREQKAAYLRALAIGDLTRECAAVFLDQESSIRNGQFDTALSDVAESKQALSAIIDVSVKKIYQSKQVVEIEASGHVILPSLLEAFTDTGIALFTKSSERKYMNLALLLPSDIRQSLEHQPTDVYTVLRIVLDFISGLTDRHAVSLYRKINGYSTN